MHSLRLNKVRKIPLPSIALLGVKGERGEQGLRGIDGNDGRDGVDGVDGINGKQGLQGIQGKRGANGKDGKQGKQGLAGNNGKQGKHGKNGADGLDGKQGIRGEVGQQGIEGQQGETGPAPKHKWTGTALQFQNPDGSWGKQVNLKGDRGIAGGEHYFGGVIETIIQGGGGEDVAYDIQSNQISDTVTYYGEAAIGSATSAAAWRVKKLTLDADGQPTVEYEGTGAFNLVWDTYEAL